MRYRSLAKFLPFIFGSLFLTYATSACAVVSRDYPFHYPHFYAGLGIGYGETTWNELATNDFLAQVSAPKETHDFGTVWSAFLGYQFGRSFALEATYTRYPNTRLVFDEYSFYYPITEFTTHSQVYSLIGKFILPLANSRINAFLDAGIALTHRNDIFAKVTRVVPTFGLGFTSNASHNVITEVGFEYYVGYGKSDHIPVKDFVPFLFGIYFRLGYRFF